TEFQSATSVEDPEKAAKMIAASRQTMQQPAKKDATQPDATRVSANVTDNPTDNTQQPADTSVASQSTDKKDQNSDGADSDIGKLQFYKVGGVRNGFGSDDPWIRPGDIVIVLEGEPIYVLGGVMAPQTSVMKDGLTLGRVIAQAGGLQKLAKSHEVNIYRQVKGKASP